MSYFSTIVARCLAITDKVLAIWTTTPVHLTTGGACTSGSINVAVNACGDTLVAQLQQMVFGGVSFLNGLLTALGAGSY